MNLPRPDVRTYRAPAPIIVAVVPGSARADRSQGRWRAGAATQRGAKPGAHHGQRRLEYKPEQIICKSRGEPGPGPSRRLEARQDMEAVEVRPPPLPGVPVGVSIFQHVAGKEAHPFLIQVPPGVGRFIEEQVRRARPRPAGEGYNRGVPMADVEGDVRIVHFIVIDSRGSINEVFFPRQAAGPTKPLHAAAKSGHATGPTT